MESFQLHINGGFSPSVLRSSKVVAANGRSSSMAPPPSPAAATPGRGSLGGLQLVSFAQLCHHCAKLKQVKNNTEYLSFAFDIKVSELSV